MGRKTAKGKHRSRQDYVLSPYFYFLITAFLVTAFLVILEWLDYAILPLLVLAQAAGAIYFLIYRWGWQELLGRCVGSDHSSFFGYPPGHTAKFLALGIVTTIAEICFAVPWYWLVVVGFIHARGLGWLL